MAPLLTAAMYNFTRQAGTDDEVKVMALSVYGQDPICQPMPTDKVLRFQMNVIYSLVTINVLYFPV